MDKERDRERSPPMPPNQATESHVHIRFVRVTLAFVKLAINHISKREMLSSQR
jgi:hypothetical protein